jgi:hypothetical protein
MSFPPEVVTQELNRYFSEDVVNGSSLGDVLLGLVQNECHGALRFEGNGIRGYVEAEFYPATTMYNSYAYLKNKQTYLKSLVITHIMIEPRGNKQIDEAVRKLFANTDIDAIAITSVILEEVKDYFIQQGWESYRETDIKLIRTYPKS